MKTCSLPSTLDKQVRIAKLLGEERTLHQPPLTTSTHSLQSY